MSETTELGSEEPDLTEGQEGDSDILASVRKQLRKEKAKAKGLEEENSDFRTTRTKQREDAITSAVSDRGYPQAMVDSLIDKVQDLSEEEYSSILADLVAEAKATEGASEEGEEEGKETSPDPAKLGQELAAAASGGAKLSEIDRLMEAKSVDEVNAVAKELGLEDV